MDYSTFEPSDDLKMFVECYWTLVNREQNPIEKQTIIPDGQMEMIFHYGDLYKQYMPDGSSILQPQCFVIGQLTRPLIIEPTGKTGIFSVRFRSTGFAPFTTLPIKVMENTAISLEKLFGKKGRQITQQILQASTTTERIEYVEAFLSKQLRSKDTINRIIKSVVETILTINGKISVNDLSRQLGVDRRQLERKFSSEIGLSPKQLIKTIRLQTAFKMLLNKEFANLADLAYENDYYDQAHFIKDFKDFTGFTPKEFYKDQFQMSTLFYGEH